MNEAKIVVERSTDYIIPRQFSMDLCVFGYHFVIGVGVEPND